MIVNRGFKYKIKPTKEQREYFDKAFGCTRKMYNYYIESLYKQLESKGFTNGKISMKEIVIDSPKDIKDKFSYMKEIDSLAFCNVQIQFKKAITKYNDESDHKSFSKRAKKREKTLGIIPTFKDIKGMPKFHSKKNNDNSFTTNNQSRGGKWSDIKLVDGMLSIPKLKSTIKIVYHRPLPNNSIIKNITISKDYKGIYYVSICVEYEIEDKKTSSNEILGLDYSQYDFYVSSEGEIANYPKYYRSMEEKLKIEQRKLSRKQLKSNNWIKQKKKISKIQNKIANQRKDWLHRKSFELAELYDVVIVEDINLRAMAQTLKLAKNLSDNGFGMFRDMLKYKLEERGKQFIKIDKWYPSSKTCSCCGNIKENLQLADRTYTCDNCGLEINRDLNASINIKEVGSTLLAW